MYTDLPSRQVKVLVSDRAVITTEDAERRTVSPAGMQGAIDAAVAAAGPGARAFARPSGTEAGPSASAYLSVIWLETVCSRNHLRYPTACLKHT
jgi:hypothetical protein